VKPVGGRGDAPSGGSTIETALVLALEAAHAGALTRGAAIRALTEGPAALLGEQHRGIVEGRSAYLTIVEMGAFWTPGAASLLSADRASPNLGLPLRAEVLATTVRGRVAYRRAEAMPSP